MRKKYEDNIISSMSVLKIFEDTKIELLSERNSLLAEIEEEKKSIDIMKSKVDKNKEYILFTEDSSNRSDNAISTRESNECDRLKKEINDLEELKLVLSKKPVLVAKKIKEALVSNNVNEAIMLIENLVSDITVVDYMDVDYTKSFDNKMNDALVKAEEDKKILKTKLDSKSYLVDNINLDNDRKLFLEKRVSFYEDASKKIKDIINSILESNNSECVDNLKTIETTIDSIEKMLESYESVDNDLGINTNEMELITKKKTEQIDDAKTYLSSYQKDMVGDVSLATHLEEESIAPLNVAVELAKRELNEIEGRLSKVTSSEVNIIEQAMDRREMEKVINKIDLIKLRLKFKESPSQLLSLIKKELNNTPVQVVKTINEFDEVMFFEPDDFELKIESNINAQDIYDIRGSKVIDVLEVEVEHDEPLFSKNETEAKPLVEENEILDITDFIEDLNKKDTVSQEFVLETDNPIDLVDFSLDEVNKSSITDADTSDKLFNFSNAFASLEIE